jgi:hypothetical protein
MSVATKLSALLLALGMALPALSASAQTNSFPASNVRVTIGGDQKDPPDVLFINRDQCVAKDNSMIQIELQNLGTTHGKPNILEFWVGPSGTDCHATSGRTWTDSVSKISPCVFIGRIQPVDARNQKASFSARQLFSSRPDTEDDPTSATPPAGLCDRQQVQALYAVPLDQATENPTVPQAKGEPIRIQFRVIVTPLPPPPAVAAGSGENQVTVRWDMPSGADQLTDYALYLDPNAIRPISDGDCTSEILKPNTRLTPEARDALERRSITDGRSYNVKPADFGLEIGEMIPIAVTAIDLAENESNLSSVVCLRRVATQSFIDACESDPDCRGSFDSCSLSHGKGSGWSGASWSGASLGALGLLLWLRRKRSL